MNTETMLCRPSLQPFTWGVTALGAAMVFLRDQQEGSRRDAWLCGWSDDCGEFLGPCFLRPSNYPNPWVLFHGCRRLLDFCLEDFFC